MKRREFITLLGGAAVWPLAARAQQAERIRKVGLLMGRESAPDARASVKALRQRLGELAWSKDRDPVDLGIVASLSRPGRNITGFTYFALAFAGKWLETLKDMAPQTRRVLLVTLAEHPALPGFQINRQSVCWFEHIGLLLLSTSIGGNARNGTAFSALAPS